MENGLVGEGGRVGTQVLRTYLAGFSVPSTCLMGVSQK